MSEEMKKGNCSPEECTTCGGCSNPLIAGEDLPGSIFLTLEDDTEVECAVLTVFPLENEEYIALLPLDENGQSTNGEVYLYRFTRLEGGLPMLANIEDDDEYDRAASAFDEIVEQMQAEKEE